MQRQHSNRRGAVVAAAVLVGVGACGSGDGGGDAGGPAGDGTLTIATVSNADAERMQELSEHFAAGHPDVELEWVTFEENELRQRVTTDIATDAGQFDVVMLGTYEVPIWAEREWLTPLDSLPEDYAVDDLLPPIRETLSYQGTPHALPFYGESAFTMYRQDLFDEAGLEMPEAPTWDFLKEAAATLGEQGDVAGICLRGKAGWGENVAFLTAMANAHGGSWFDEDWTPQFDTEPWQRTVDDYVALGQHAPPGVEENGYAENLELFAAGECAIWVDSTAAASYVSDPDRSEVADSVGFALAPDAGADKRSNWLWAWALAVPESSGQQEDAVAFVTWATSAEYTELVAQEYGWLQAPPGTRTSLYENPEYQQAAPFADLALESIETADPADPTEDEVPYTGIQYVGIPEFQSIGTAVGGRFSLALAGEITAEEALDESQWVTDQVIERTRFIEE